MQHLVLILPCFVFSVRKSRESERQLPRVAANGKHRKVGEPETLIALFSRFLNPLPSIASFLLTVGPAISQIPLRKRIGNAAMPGRREDFSKDRDSHLTYPEMYLNEQRDCLPRSHLEDVWQSSAKLIDADLAAMSKDNGEEPWLSESSSGGVKSWLSEDSVQQIRIILEGTRFDAESTMGSFIASSPLPISSTLYKSEILELTLLHAPAGMETAPRRHYPGTVLLYFGLYGEGVLRSMIGSREIQRCTIKEPLRVGGYGGVNASESECNTRSVRRLGGPSRIFEGWSWDGAGILELAIYAPRSLSVEVGAQGGTGAPASLSPPITNADSVNAWLSKVVAWTGANIDDEATSAIHVALVTEGGTPLPGNADMLISSMEHGLRASSEREAEKTRKHAVIPRLEESVGGLSKELDKIVARVLLSRQFQPSTIKELGLAHVKGLLLHGPPGTGKTLIARQLARALNAREPIIVNGPEIMDKFVGESERNIRDLFKAAEDEWKTRGEESELHMIVFDEFDAIAKTRGVSDGSGTKDSVVNQLLTKLDGVEELPNVLVVAITNRKDLIDPALLRPGRLEVHVRIDAPRSAAQRAEIMCILLRPMQQCGRVQSSDVERMAWSTARRTRGFTGADLAGALRAAGSIALQRYLENLGTVGRPAVRSAVGMRRKVEEAPDLFVTAADLHMAVDEMKHERGHAGTFRRAFRNVRKRVGNVFKK